MSNATILKVHFLNEWTPKDFSLIESAMRKHFYNKTLRTNKGDVKMWGKTMLFHQIDKVLGLAYTSSSSFAMYGICNVELKYDEQYNYQFFAISGDHKCYAILWDKDENEKIIEL